MTDAEWGPDAQALVAQREDARCWAVLLEGMLARSIAAQRSVALLCLRAEADRDTALQRLSSCAAENAAYRHQLETAVAARDELAERLRTLALRLSGVPCG